MTVATLGQKTVLVIEDDPWTRTITTALLAGEGFAVVEAKNGEEGLKQARSMRRTPFCWIWRCPPSRAWTCCASSRPTSDVRRSRCIIVSAYGSLMNETDAHQAVGVIQKPFDYDDLVGQVERATARSLEVALT